MTNIIVPLYNEEKRAPQFLSDLIKFCLKDSGKYCITFVNDGSTDNTLDILKPYINNYTFIHLISYQPNKGKGFAVKKAILESNTDFVIFIDADGSISPDEITNFTEKLKSFDVVVGSRALKQSEAIQHPARKLIGIIFNIIANSIFKTGIQDNLCGIKGFNIQTAHFLFNKLRTDRWIFDVELFYWIKKEKLLLCQIPIRWVYVSGSKIRVFDPALMFFNLITLRLKLLVNKD